MITEVTALQKKYDELSIPREEEIASYYKLRQQLERLGREMQTFIVSPKYCVPFLQPGRMVKVSKCILLLLIIHVSHSIVLFRLRMEMKILVGEV